MNTVDELWHAAILDTKLYADLQSAMGVVLHHRPSGAPEQESEPREKRLKKMSAMYTAFFSTNPLGVSAQPHPSLQPNLSEAHLISKAPLHPSLLPQPNVIKTNSVPDETLSIDVLIFNGMELRFKVRTRTSARCIMRAIEEKTDISGTTLRIFFDGRRLEDGDTVGFVNMKDGDTILCTTEQRGC